MLLGRHATDNNMQKRINKQANKQTTTNKIILVKVSIEHRSATDLSEKDTSQRWGKMRVDLSFSTTVHGFIFFNYSAWIYLFQQRRMDLSFSTTVHGFIFFQQRCMDLSFSTTARGFIFFNSGAWVIFFQQWHIDLSFSTTAHRFVFFNNGA